MKLAESARLAAHAAPLAVTQWAFEALAALPTLS
jgi:hypothetical protein